jgi:hypothetical protein
VSDDWHNSRSGASAFRHSLILWRDGPAGDLDPERFGKSYGSHPLGNTCRSAPIVVKTTRTS